MLKCFFDSQIMQFQWTISYLKCLQYLQPQTFDNLVPSGNFSWKEFLEGFQSFTPANCLMSTLSNVSLMRLPIWRSIYLVQQFSEVINKIAEEFQFGGIEGWTEPESKRVRECTKAQQTYINYNERYFFLNCTRFLLVNVFVSTIGHTYLSICTHYSFSLFYSHTNSFTRIHFSSYFFLPLCDALSFWSWHNCERASA